MNVVIVDYGSGNLRSAAKAFVRAGEDAGISADIRVSADPDQVARADRVVLPGVGAFADCRRGVGAVDGLEAALIEAVVTRGQPFFGICVGMQLMARRGLEHQISDGFGWIPGDVKRMEVPDPAMKIPHMGWNELVLPDTRHPVLAGIEDHALVYFVHSFAFYPEDDAMVLAETDYGGPVVAAIGRDNLFGTQFHPEKSQAIGLSLIANFLKWRP